MISLLLSMTLVLTGATIFGVRRRRAENRVWLPLAFFLANVLLLAADLFMTQLSWAHQTAWTGPGLLRQLGRAARAGRAGCFQ